MSQVKCYMLKRYRVFGYSMLPTLQNGQPVLAESLSYLFKAPEVGDMVIVKGDRTLVKRITQKIGDRYFVEGDNQRESADSRNFGFINKNSIMGKVIVL